MAAVKVSVVALRHVCCCPGAIRDRPAVGLDYLVAEWLRLLHKFRIQSANNESHRVLDADNSGEYTAHKTRPLALRGDINLCENLCGSSPYYSRL